MTKNYQAKYPFNSKTYFFLSQLLEKLARHADKEKDMRNKTIIYLIICDIIKKQAQIRNQLWSE